MRALICQLIVAIFYAVSATAGELHDAAKAGDRDAVAGAIARGADVNEVDFLSGSALHIAAVRGHVEIVRDLVAAGADTGVVEWGIGDTPLHWAAMAGQLESMAALIAAGANLDARNDKRATPLHSAADRGKADAMRLLLAAGADGSARMYNGHSVIHRAGRAGLFEIVEIIQSGGGATRELEDVRPYLATADPERGKAIFEVDGGCRQCHQPPESRQAHSFGPSLWNVVGRDKASSADYSYSEAFNRLEGVWDYASLNGLLANSMDYAPGTAMYNDDANDAYLLENVEDRADVISFLRLQSDDPVPLP